MKVQTERRKEEGKEKVVKQRCAEGCKQNEYNENKGKQRTQEQKENDPLPIPATGIHSKTSQKARHNLTL